MLRVAVLLCDKEQDIVYIDFDRLDEFHLEDDVIVDVYGIRRLGTVFLVEVKVQTLIVFVLVVSEDFFAFELVEALQNVA